jgi:hypothetical protein
MWRTGDLNKTRPTLIEGVIIGTKPYTWSVGTLITRKEKREIYLQSGVRETKEYPAKICGRMPAYAT